MAPAKRGVRTNSTAFANPSATVFTPPADCWVHLARSNCPSHRVSGARNLCCVGLKLGEPRRRPQIAARAVRSRSGPLRGRDFGDLSALPDAGVEQGIEGHAE